MLERERERVCVCMCEDIIEGERVCVFSRSLVRVYVYVYVCVCALERERICVSLMTCHLNFVLRKEVRLVNATWIFSSFHFNILSNINTIHKLLGIPNIRSITPFH